MKSLSRGFQSGEEGKVKPGCIFSIVLMAIVVFLAIKLIPVYFNNYEFKGELKQAVSRAGARAIQNEDIVRDLIATAGKNNIVLQKEKIQISRTSGQLYIAVEYSVPVNFLIMKRDLNFKLEESGITLF